MLSIDKESWTNGKRFNPHRAADLKWNFYLTSFILITPSYSIKSLCQTQKVGRLLLLCTPPGYDKTHLILTYRGSDQVFVTVSEKTHDSIQFRAYVFRSSMHGTWDEALRKKLDDVPAPHNFLLKINMINAWFTTSRLRGSWNYFTKIGLRSKDRFHCCYFYAGRMERIRSANQSQCLLPYILS